MFKRLCVICKKEFETRITRHKVCSFQCRMKANRDNARHSTRIKRKRLEGANPCEICGWSKTIDRHHEDDGIHYLCPNHHSLITRNGVNISELI